VDPVPDLLLLRKSGSAGNQTWISGSLSLFPSLSLSLSLYIYMYIYICYVEESRPPVWSSGQSSWLEIQKSKFDFRRYQIF
jgi:hypothetical protein